MISGWEEGLVVFFLPPPLLPPWLKRPPSPRRPPPPPPPPPPFPHGISQTSLFFFTRLCRGTYKYKDSHLIAHSRNVGALRHMFLHLFEKYLDWNRLAILFGNLAALLSGNLMVRKVWYYHTFATFGHIHSFFSFFFTVVEKDYNRAQRRLPGCNSLWALASTLLGTAVLEPEMPTIEANLAKSVSESKILC